MMSPFVRLSICKGAAHTSRTLPALDEVLKYRDEHYEADGRDPPVNMLPHEASSMLRAIRMAANTPM